MRIYECVNSRDTINHLFKIYNDSYFFGQFAFKCFFFFDFILFNNQFILNLNLLPQFIYRFEKKLDSVESNLYEFKIGTINVSKHFKALNVGDYNLV